MEKKDNYLKDAGSVRKYVLQIFHELKYGFLNEIDLPTFYTNVDSIDVLFENDMVAGKESNWIPFIERLKLDVEKYQKEGLMIDFLIDYLFTHLDMIVDRIKLNEVKIPKTNRLGDLEKLLPEINNSVFKNSTLKQWESLIINECLDEAIRIDVNTSLKEFVYFFDKLKEKIGFKITDKVLIEIKAFKYEGILLNYNQVINARRDYKKNGINSTELDRLLN